MALEDFMANLEVDGKVGEKAFEADIEPKEEEKATPAVPPTDNKPEQDKPPKEGDNTPPQDTIPFHKHPRWIKTQEELAELRKFKEEAAAKLLERIPPKEEANVSIPDWFPKSGKKEVDEQKYKEYLAYESGVKAQIKQELVEDQTREAKAKAEEEKKWTKWVNDSLDTLEDEGLKFDRKELQAVALKYLPSDENGNIDFKRAYEIMTELKKIQPAPKAEQADARKKVGDLANTSKSTSEQAKPKFETQRSLRNRSFDQLINETN